VALYLLRLDDRIHRCLTDLLSAMTTGNSTALQVGHDAFGTGSMVDTVLHGELVALADREPSFGGLTSLGERISRGSLSHAFAGA
jgi:hypothetical protein